MKFRADMPFTQITVASQFPSLWGRARDFRPTKTNNAVASQKYIETFRRVQHWERSSGPCQAATWPLAGHRGVQSQVRRPCWAVGLVVVPPGGGGQGAVGRTGSGGQSGTQAAGRTQAPARGPSPMGSWQQKLFNQRDVLLKSFS